MATYTLEVCVDSVESAKAAVQGGANRLEICGGLASGGGLTPSYGLVLAVQASCPGVPLMIMIRPRCGDFVYSEEEIDVMMLDIQAFKALGVAGIVLGILTPDGDVDVERTTRLVQEARPMQVTFHRAFDMTRDLPQALSQIGTITGISRVLTSGGSPTVVAGLPTLRQLLLAVPAHLTIMVGSGISPWTINNIITTLLPHNIREIHMSGGEWRPGKSTWKREGMGMGMGIPEKEWDVLTSSSEKVQFVRYTLNSL